MERKQINWKMLLAWCALSVPLFFMTGCEQEWSADEHFKAAMEAIDDDDQLALTIWHLEEYLEATKYRPSDDAGRVYARLHFDKCVERFIQTHGGIGVSGAKLHDLELKVSLLENKNNELNSWISRLDAENQTLREHLLRLQNKDKAPSKSESGKK